MSNERNKNTSGIKDFLWAIQQTVNAVNAGRIVVFGNGRSSACVPDNKIKINVDDLTSSNNQSDNENED